MERVVVDSSVWIQIERDPTRFDELIDKRFQLFMPAIVLAELQDDAQASSANEAQRQRALEFVHVLETITEFVAIDKGIIQRYVELLTFCRQSGKPRGLADLLIAATAIQLDAAILSLDNRARFAELPNLRVIS
jgi:predicted nucleic acid-binding protein